MNTCFLGQILLASCRKTGVYYSAIMQKKLANITMQSSAPPQIKKQLLPLFFVIFIDSLGFGLTIPVLLHLLVDPHGGLLASTLSHASRNIIFGLSIAISPLATLIGTPIIGAWSDRWGRKRMMLVCLLGTCVGFLLPVLGVLMGSLSVLLLGRVIGGLTSSSQPIAQAAITDISRGKQRSMYLSLIAFAMTLAMVVGPLIGGFLSDPSLVSWFNSTTPFMVAAGLSFINLLFLAYGFTETNQRRNAQRQLSLRETYWALTAAIKLPNTRLLLLMLFLLQFAWSLYFQAIPLYLTQVFHFTTTHSAVFLGVIGIWMSLALTLIFRLILPFIKMDRLLILCIASCLCSLIACVLWPTPYTQWRIIVPLAFGAGIAYPAVVSLISQQIDEFNQGWIMGVASAVLSFAWLWTGTFSGVLVNLNPRLPFIVSICAYLVCASALLYWQKSSHRRTGDVLATG